jgi:hypothetical protein
VSPKKLEKVRDKLLVLRDHRQRALCSELEYLKSVSRDEDIIDYEERLGATPDRRRG